MKQNNCAKSVVLRLLLCGILIAVSVMALCGCGTKKEPDESAAQPSESFQFSVVFSDGTTREKTVPATGFVTVGEALQAAGLISGEESVYGLYVKTVCGETHVYEQDGKYWAFYVNGEYAVTGVDATDITAGSTYEFRAE